MASPGVIAVGFVMARRAMRGLGGSGCSKDASIRVRSKNLIRFWGLGPFKGLGLDLSREHGATHFVTASTVWGFTESASRTACNPLNLRPKNLNP